MKMISESHRRIIRELVHGQFLDPEDTNLQYLIQLVETCLKSVVEHQGSGPTYPYTLDAVPISTAIESAEIPYKPVNVHDAISNMYQHIQGIVKVNHPFMVKNIIPTPSLVHLVVNLAVSLYMPNGVTGEDAAESLLSEVRCAAALSKLLGYDHWKSAGVFTFGGTGTNLYAIRVGLQKSDKNYITDGYKGDCVVVSSWPAHFSQQSVAMWLGIGLNNYIQAKSNQDQTTDLKDLKLKCENAIFAGKKLACIIGVGGSTSNMAIDDFSKICAIRDKLVEEHNLNYKPHVHADSVIGWAYANFLDYNYKENLDLPKSVIKKIEKILERIRTVKYADSFSADFHKTGYMPYVSSMIVFKKKADMDSLARSTSTMSPLFHDENAYNPGKFTLETSRSAANMVATWLSLQTFGREGYCALLARALCIAEIIRNKIDSIVDSELLVVNKQSYGSDIFIRCYPPDVNSIDISKKELHDENILRDYSKYNASLFAFLEKFSKHQNGIGVGKTSAAFYTVLGSPVVALRIYILNPFLEEEQATMLIDKLVEQKKVFDCLYSQ